MWLFLATEVMFFGGLITAYAVYRSTSPRGDRAGQPAHDRLAGLPEHRDPAGQQPDDGPGRPRRRSCGTHRELVIYLVLTMVLGTAFLGVKAIEYTRITTST